MGFLDKILETIKSKKDPLYDETVKKYYEIIYGLYTVDYDWRLCSKKNKVAETYIVLQIKEQIITEKLQKAIELFDISCRDNDMSDTAKYLKEYNKKLKAENKYVDKTFDIYDSCYQEEYATVKSEYQTVLHTVKDEPTFALLGRGIEKLILQKFTAAIGYSEVRVLTRRVIAESFCENDETTRKAVLDYFNDVYRNRIHHNKYSFVNPKDSVVLMALKALHFEKYGKNKAGYTTISDDDCRELVLSYKYYSDVIDSHPFDKEEYIKKFIKEINCGVFRSDYSTYSSKYLELTNKDTYFCDAVCNLAWKEVIKSKWKDENGDDKTNSTDIIDVIRILWTYYQQI